MLCGLPSLPIAQIAAIGAIGAPNEGAPLQSLNELETATDLLLSWPSPLGHPASAAHALLPPPLQPQSTSTFPANLPFPMASDTEIASQAPIRQGATELVADYGATALSFPHFPNAQSVLDPNLLPQLLNPSKPLQPPPQVSQAPPQATVTDSLAVSAAPSAIISSASKSGPRRGNIPRSCTFCARQKIRCSYDPGATSCSSCLRRNIPCIPRLSFHAARTNQPPEPAKPAKRPHPASLDSPLPTFESFLAHHYRPPPPRVFTPYDDLPALPSPDLRNHFLLASFQEAQATISVFDGHAVLAPTLPPFVALALEAVAAHFCRSFNEADALAARAARDAVKILNRMVLKGPADGDPVIAILQAMLCLTAFGVMAGNMVVAGGVELRWLALTVALARRMGLNFEVPELPSLERERRRRIWWYLFIIDGLYAVFNDTEPTIREHEALHLRINGSEHAWFSNPREIAPEAAPFWVEVLAAVDAPPAPVSPLSSFWARELLAVTLSLRAASVSRRLWRPHTAPPTSSDTAPHLAALDAWHTAFAQFHRVGVPDPSSAGPFRRGEYSRSIVWTAGMLVASPRWAVDALFADGPAVAVAAVAATLGRGGDAGLPPEVVEAHRVLQEWAASPHAAQCRALLDAAVAYWTGMDGGDLAEEERLRGIVVASGPRFYDASVSFLGMLQFDLVYAGKVMTVLEVYGVVGGEGEGFEGLQRAARGLAEVYRGFRHLWAGVVAVREAVGVIVR
ncbi:hypothetical protein HDU96_002975 [Phlyctochytrium bullatum]|nr:hypothetical protein HDU96_002975 [Phlyctochytrium bullatum]